MIIKLDSKNNYASTASCNIKLNKRSYDIISKSRSSCFDKSRGVTAAKHRRNAYDVTIKVKPNKIATYSEDLWINVTKITFHKYPCLRRKYLSSFTPLFDDLKLKWRSRQDGVCRFRCCCECAVRKRRSRNSSRRGSSESFGCEKPRSGFSPTRLHPCAKIEKLFFFLNFD